MSTAFAGSGSKSSLLNVADLIRGVTYKKHEARTQPEPGLIPVLRATNLQNGRLVLDDLVYVPAARVSAVQRIRKGDIVIAMSSGSREVVGKAALVTSDWEGAFGAFCGVLRAKPGTSPELLSHFLQSPIYRAAIEQVATGTNINNLSKTTLAAIDASLPRPEAQEGLGRLLTELDECRRSSSAHLSIAARASALFRQAVLDAAGSGRLTSDWRGERELQPAAEVIAGLGKRHGASPTRVRRGAVVASSMVDLNIASLPESWSVAPLSLLCEPGRPITYGILKPGPQVDGGVPYVRVTDFKSGTVSVPGLKRTSPLIAEAYRRSALRAGDLLFAIRGTYGHVATVPPELGGANITQDTARLTIDPAVSAHYVLYALRAPNVQSRISRAAKGVAVQGVNLGDLRELLLSIPPHAEQLEIVRRVEGLLSVAERLDGRLAIAARTIARGSMAVLAKAFGGDLMLSRGGES